MVATLPFMLIFSFRCGILLFLNLYIMLHAVHVHNAHCFISSFSR